MCAELFRVGNVFCGAWYWLWYGWKSPTPAKDRRFDVKSISTIPPPSVWLELLIFFRKWPLH